MTNNSPDVDAVALETNSRHVDKQLLTVLSLTVCARLYLRLLTSNDFQLLTQVAACSCCIPSLQFYIPQTKCALKYRLLAVSHDIMTRYAITDYMNNSYSGRSGTVVKTGSNCGYLPPIGQCAISISLNSRGNMRDNYPTNFRH